MINFKEKLFLEIIFFTCEINVRYAATGGRPLVGLKTSWKQNPGTWDVVAHKRYISPHFQTMTDIDVRLRFKQPRSIRTEICHEEMSIFFVLQFCEGKTLEGKYGL